MRKRRQNKTIAPPSGRDEENDRLMTKIHGKNRFIIREDDGEEELAIVDPIKAWKQ